MIETNGNGRFSREQLAGYHPATMNKATILVVGAGALAQSLVPNLALPGIGEIRVVDFDAFEPHNASRSFYYPTLEEQERWGLMKAKIVAHKAHLQMLADTPVMRYALVPIQQLGLGAFDGVDVAISAVDNPRARAYLSDACRYLGITLIEGGFDGPAVAMSCFPGTAAEEAETQPCYRCGNPHLVGTFSCQRYAAEAAQAGIIAAIQPASSALAGMMAEATIQAIHGEYPTAFKRTMLNVRSGEHRQYSLTRSAKCPGIHGRLTDVPIDLDVTGADSLKKLIDSIEQRFGTGCEIELGEPFVVEAYCMSCGDVIIVHAPEWAYDMQPRCEACSGPWNSTRKPKEGHVVVKPIRLTATEEPRILAANCSQAGLVAMNLVYAHRRKSSTSGVFRMAGGISDLYEEVLSTHPVEHGDAAVPPGNLGKT